MALDFNRIIDRRTISNINKWKWYPDDVLPFWIADMDFPAPEPILDALRQALDHGILGYEIASQSLLELIAGRLHKLYLWDVSPEMVIPVPGINIAYRTAASIICPPGEGIIVQPPVFYQFNDFPEQLGWVRQDAPLQRTEMGQNIGYSLDSISFLQAIHSMSAKSSMFLLCNPHNPTGNVFSVAELSSMVEMCTVNNIFICSDDNHNELLLGDAIYTPIASLSPSISDHSITLLGPTKTYNLSGLGGGFAIIPNPDVRNRFTTELSRHGLEISSLSLIAARTAYSGECDEWLSALRCYLTANRDYLVNFIRQEIPEIRVTKPDATYLAWLDCNELIAQHKIQDSAGTFFLAQAKVALYDGSAFGNGGEGYVRLNFACPRMVLEEGLNRMKLALNK